MRSLESSLRLTITRGEAIPEEGRSFQGRVIVPVSVRILRDANLSVEDFIKLL